MSDLRCLLSDFYSDALHTSMSFPLLILLLLSSSVPIVVSLLSLSVYCWCYLLVLVICLLVLSLWLACLICSSPYLFSSSVFGQLSVSALVITCLLLYCSLVVHCCLKCSWSSGYPLLSLVSWYCSSVDLFMYPCFLCVPASSTDPKSSRS